MVGTRSEGQFECKSVKMKVQTTEDAKVVIVDDKGSEVDQPYRRQPFSESNCPPYQAPTPYLNVSKYILLVLAIVATFLACLIFVRDLWGVKETVEKSSIVHPLHLKHQPDMESRFRFPFEDNFMDDFPRFVFKKQDHHGKEDDDGPRVISKTRITFHLTPTDEEEDPKRGQIEKIGTSNSEVPIDDIMKMMMNMMEENESRPSARIPPSLEKPSLFGDLPMFNHQSQPIHPKLIIVRRLHPNPASPPTGDDDFFQNILNGIINPPNPSDRKSNEPFPLIPIQQGEKDPLESIFSKMTSDGFPILPSIIVRKLKHRPTENVPTKITAIPVKPEPEESASAWKDYKRIISTLATSIDDLLNDASSLEVSIKKELGKLEDKVTSPEENSDTTQISSEKEESSTKFKQYLMDTQETLGRIKKSLTDASITIKTEDGALDLVTRTDVAGLVEAIDTFMKSLQAPLDGVFEASTKLTKTNGNEKDISEDTYEGIVKYGKELVHFGKMMYEDMVALRSSLVKHGDAKEKPVMKVGPRETQPENTAMPTLQ